MTSEPNYREMSEAAPELTEGKPKNLYPGILIAIWIFSAALSPVANVLLARMLSIASYPIYFQTVSSFFVFRELAAVWWLALLVPHSRHSIQALAFMLLVPLIFSVSIFAGFTERDAAFAIFLWQVVSSISTAAITYCMLSLFSHLSGIGLVRNGTQPTIARLGVARIMWITVVAAVSFGVFQLYQGSSDDPLVASLKSGQGIYSVYAVFSALPVIIVTWLYALGRRYLILAFAINFFLAYVLSELLMPWLVRQISGEDFTTLLTWQAMLVSVFLHTSGLILGMWICKLCGYRLAALEFRSAQAE